MLNNDAILLVDWTNYSSHLEHGSNSEASLVSNLIDFAKELCERYGDLRLVGAHFVGVDFSPEAARRIDNDLIAEQHKSSDSDLRLAVIAMDHLLSKTGTPKLFILAVGDHDFIPLIERIKSEGSQAALVTSADSLMAPGSRSIPAIFEFHHVVEVASYLGAAGLGGIVGNRADSLIRIIATGLFKSVHNRWIKRNVSSDTGALSKDEAIDAAEAAAIASGYLFGPHALLEANQAEDGSWIILFTGMHIDNLSYFERLRAKVPAGNPANTTILIYPQGPVRKS